MRAFSLEMSEGFLSKTALSPVNSSPKVAIVIPVCDVAPYLEDCLDSVLRQTFSNFQIFAVDDKSSDSSPSILKKYIEEDDRVSALFLGKLCKIRNFSQSPFGGFIFEESDGNFPSGRN